MRKIFGLITALGMFAVSANAAIINVSDELQPTPAAEVTALTWDAVCCDGALSDLGPGKYELTFIHPHTCCPVTVCFELPCLECCEKIEVECGKGLFCAYNLEFNYPGCNRDVVIKFKKDGSVVVK